MKRTVKLTERELKRMISESVKRILKEGKNDFEAAKYQGKWSVFDKGSKTFSHIGVGKKKASAKAKELNTTPSDEEKINEAREYIPNAVYIVFDGTSHYGVFGCDVEDEIMSNDVEVVKGPFAKWDDNVDRMIEDLNDEANGAKYDRRYSLYEAKFSQGSVLKALSQCGWAYSNAYDVTNSQTGQKGVRYIIEPYAGNLDNVKPLDAEQLKQKMVELFGQDKVIFSQGQHRNAPELKNLSMIVLK